MERSRQIREYVERFAPSKAASIQNPKQHYSDLATEYLQKWNQVLEELEPPGVQPSTADKADPLALMGTARRNRAQADETAWQEVVLDRYPPEVDETGNALTE